jgi:hypothetical protein
MQWCRTTESVCKHEREQVINIILWKKREWIGKKTQFVGYGTRKVGQHEVRLVFGK